MRSSIERRLRTLQAHNADKLLQAICKARCAVDPKYFINEWVWTYDPREEVSYVPFVMYPRQEEFIDFLWGLEHDQVSGVADKSRDMGFTWLCAAYLVHRWLFRRGFAGGIGSRKRDLVDKLGDPDSIFEKMRIILKKLPSWMLPEGFDWKKHDNHLRLVNPDGEAVIAGEAGDNIGRGGRKTIYVVDEAAWLQKPLVVDAALSNNTKTIVYVSTPNGPGNPFAKKRFSGSYRVFTMHWMDDPRKAHWVSSDGSSGVGRPPAGKAAVYPWYEDMKRRFDPVTIAQEVDIDYAASIEGVVCPGRWVQAAVAYWRRIDPTLEEPPVAGFDVAAEGSNNNAVVVRRGPIVRSGDVIVWDKTDTFVTARKAAEIVRESKAKKCFYDGDGIGASVAGNWKHGPDLGFDAVGIRNNWRPSKRRQETGKTAEQTFVNLRAENWWSLRRRLEKTFEHMEYDVEYEPSELIALPDIPELMTELSLPLYEKNSVGKIKIESKQDMRSRGVKSPDIADALVMTFSPDVRPTATGAASYSEETY